MSQNSAASEPDQDSDAESEFVEVDPSGRYGRYKQVLGKGAFKKVYRAFDEREGLEVAWNQVKVTDLLRNSVDLERLYSEVHLLKTLKHKNIIKFYNSWVDTKNEHINFITEIFTSGTLRQYRKKHKHVDVRALKKWSRQILEGLYYLHSNDPPVIHRDVKCDNIFVNGNQGEVKIGDLGLAAILQQARAAHSVIGTPEFMAPELYEEEYNELVDIYAFGMCLLELVTLEYPYVECANAAQIYKKVTSGIKPASLSKVQDVEVREFIEKCIAKVSNRLSANELLHDPFLLDGSCEIRGHSLEPPSYNHRLYNDKGKVLVDAQSDGPRDFTVHGQRKDHNTIFLKLRIADSSGTIRNIHFPFDIEEDTSIAVASEMVQELDLTDHDVSVIAAIIDSEIRYHIPEWAPGELLCSNSVSGGETIPESGGEASPGGINDFNPLVLEKLPSGRKIWCNSPRACNDSPLRPGSGHLTNVSIASGDSWSEENTPALLEIQEVSTSADVTPVHCAGSNSDPDSDRNEEEEEEEEEEEGEDDEKDHLLDDTPIGANRCFYNTPGSEPPSGEENMMTCQGEPDSSVLRFVVEKLEQVLDEQARELDELKQKHKLDLLDFIKDLPQDIRLRALSMCKDKISSYKVDDQ